MSDTTAVLPRWTKVDADGLTFRLPVPGGWLYRTGTSLQTFVEDEESDAHLPPPPAAVRLPGVAVPIEVVVRVVCKRFGILLRDLQSKKRNRGVAYPRQVAMVLARRLTDMSLVEIGAFFGGRDHTTVLYGLDTIERKEKCDGQVARLVAALTSEIRTASPEHNPDA